MQKPINQTFKPKPLNRQAAKPLNREAQKPNRTEPNRIISFETKPNYLYNFEPINR